MASSKETPNDEENKAIQEDHKEEEEWILARQGINLIVNNNQAEAEKLFLDYPNSLLMYAGYSFAVFMDALMSFEEEKLSKAILILKEVEKRCTTQNGWLKSISQRVFGTSNGNQLPLAQQLETQIILADSQVCIATLTFLQQDLSGYFKGGWVLRKAWKVYQKTYNEVLTLYREQIGELHLPDPMLTTPSVTPPLNYDEDSVDPDNEKPSSDWDMPEAQINGYTCYSKSTISQSRSLNFPRNKSVNFVDTNEILVSSKSINNNTRKSQKINSLALKKSASVTEALSTKSKTNVFGSTKFNFRPFTTSLSLNSFTSPLNHILPGQAYVESQKIDNKTLVRLMGAVSFGYGLFQLGVSLLPLSLTRVISLLGFTANRQNGIACLMYARLGVDMRAPLASLALLWYHTIVRPFYAIDGTNVQAGVEAASALIRESKVEFENASMFLFFDGRTSRLNSDISAALKSFQKAKENANQREIKILCLHEIGWCHLIQLDYEKAKNTFLYLKCSSRWSRAFYGYLAAICIGASQDFQNYIIFDNLQTSNIGTGTRSGQLDEFLNRRLHCCPKDAESAKKNTAIYFKVLVFEMLYLWNALASCSKKDICRIITDCKNVSLSRDEPRKGLSNLILGSCYIIQQNFSEAIASFRECLQKRIHELNNAEDAHISAFAQHELGNILLQKDETKEEGKLLLQQVSRYDHYDFEARLNVRIHNILKQL